MAGGGSTRHRHHSVGDGTYFGSVCRQSHLLGRQILAGGNLSVASRGCYSGFMRAFILIILLTLLTYVGGFLVFLATLPKPPADPHADGIVALTGGGMRLDTAVALLEHGAAKRLLISGVDMQTNKETLGHMAQGGPRFSCCADMGYAAEDTHGNAEEAANGFASMAFAVFSSSRPVITCRAIARDSRP